MEHRWSGPVAPSSPMRAAAIVVVLGTALAATALVAPMAAASGDGPKAPRTSSAVDYSRAVTHICAGALLFDHAHHMGTRADALAIARDIRASTARRLVRVIALAPPAKRQRVSRRWISSQRRLAAMFARTWVRIYDTIAAARTPAQRATLAGRLEKLVHAPDRLKLAAGRLELALRVPDCTGGG
jgi:hypothetical protein